MVVRILFLPIALMLVIGYELAGLGIVPTLVAALLPVALGEYMLAGK